jgi:hypothetical protein
MPATKKPLSQAKKDETPRWRWTWVGLGAAVVVFVVAVLQGALGNLISDWWKERGSKPEFQIRYLLLDLQEPRLIPGSSFPLEDETLSVIFSGAPVYVQHNAVLSKAAEIVTSFLGDFKLGVQRHPTLEEYESLLTSDEKFTKWDRGSTKDGVSWGLDVLSSHRRLLERGVLTRESAKQLARANLDREGFFYTQVADPRTYCGADPDAQDHFYQEEVFAPSFMLILLDITNTSPTPARDLSFESRQYRIDGPSLRLYTSLGPDPADPIETEHLSFPIGALQRGEHVLVPLSVLAEKPTLGTPESPFSPLRRNLTSATNLNVGQIDRVEFYRSNLSNSENAYYYFGPAVRITSVNEGSNKTAIRDLAIQNFTYSTVSVAGVGSCPSLSFRLATDSSWTPLRHVLVGAEGKKREREEVHELNDFGGELILREEDNEISFLSRVAVEITGRGGPRVCLPQESASTRLAGGAFILHRHDELRIGCALRVGEAARLIVRGYYEPINNGK